MLPEPLALPTESTAPLPDTSAPLPEQATQLPPRYTEPTATNEATDLLDAGEAALRMHDRKSALELFGQAHLMRDQLDRADRDRLQEHLHMLASEPVDRQIPAAITPPDTRQAQLPQAPRAVVGTGRPVPEALPLPSSDTPADTRRAVRFFRRALRIRGFTVWIRRNAVGHSGNATGHARTYVRLTSGTDRSTDDVAGDSATRRNDCAECFRNAAGRHRTASHATGRESFLDGFGRGERSSARPADLGRSRQTPIRSPAPAREGSGTGRSDPPGSPTACERFEALRIHTRELLSRIEITLNKTEKYIADHRAEIELDSRTKPCSTTSIATAK